VSSAKPGDDSLLNSLQQDHKEIMRIIPELAKERIPRRFGFDPVDDIQVLTPMHQGVVGAGNLNMELQKALNPGEGVVMKGNRNYRVNDKVMQIKNNCDKEVYYVLLERNLIYTVVTRGRKLVVIGEIFGSPFSFTVLSKNIELHQQRADLTC